MSSIKDRLNEIFESKKSKKETQKATTDQHRVRSEEFCKKISKGNAKKYKACIASAKKRFGF